MCIQYTYIYLLSFHKWGIHKFTQVYYVFDLYQMSDWLCSKAYITLSQTKSCTTLLFYIKSDRQTIVHKLVHKSYVCFSQYN